MKWRSLLICILVEFSFGVGFAQAQVKINEVYPQPLSGELEWVELINTATSSVDLSGWVIEDVLSSPKTIFTFTQDILLPNKLIVASFSGQLNNSTDGVTIKNLDGAIIDQMNYDLSTQGLSWSLDLSGDYLLTNPSRDLANVFPTPTPNSSPLPTPSPTPVVIPTPVVNPNNATLENISQLQLTRASICPESGPEWLEWFNPTSVDLAVNLEIVDLQNNRLPLLLKISSQQKVTTTLSRNIFNNSGDGLTVFYQNQQLQEYFFPGCESADALYSFSSAASWPQNVVLTNDVSLIKDRENKPVTTIVASSTVPSPKPITARFVFPVRVIENLRSNLDDEKIALSGQNSSASGSVLGQITTSPPRRSPLAPILIICGGFFWLGLGIIELYGEQSSTDFSVA